jgi:hypothetical protein
MSAFRRFYQQHFLPEHQHPANQALHVLAVFASAGLVGLSFVLRLPWLALAYPFVHAAPGLLGHRLFERSAAVGDLRLTRQDFPLWWFIVANHLLVVDLVRGRALASRPD